MKAATSRERDAFRLRPEGGARNTQQEMLERHWFIERS